MSDRRTQGERHESYKELLAQYEAAVKRLGEQARDPLGPNEPFEDSAAEVARLTGRLIALRTDLAGSGTDA